MVEDLLAMKPGLADARLTEAGFADPGAALKNLRLLSSGPFAPMLDRIFEAALASPSPHSALNNLERIAAATPFNSVAASLRDEKQKTIKRLLTICGSSEYLSSILIRHPALYERAFVQGGLDSAGSEESFGSELRKRTPKCKDREQFSRALRLYKQEEFLRIGARDLLGLAQLEETTRELSDLASATLEAALEFALEDLKKIHGTPVSINAGVEEEAEFAVIGLGKLGGRELNFSSDIDILYIYSSDNGETTGDGGGKGKTSLHAFFIKLSETITRLVGAVTEDGLVFRVDLDLRPGGRSGAAANSLRSAEIYYESWGRSWERAAFIKARPVAGSAKLGAAFLDMIRPFVYRRNLDFTAIEEIKSMKERIDFRLLASKSAPSGTSAPPGGVNVKLAPGGIREIEFFCQALQLIHAGKDADLRKRNTLAAVAILLEKGYIKQAEADTLTNGYEFLRNLEHRLQIVEGRQTHTVPTDADALKRVACMMGFVDASAFSEAFEKTTGGVHRVYHTLFYASAEDASRDVPDRVLLLFSPDLTRAQSIAELTELGFTDTETAVKNLEFLKNPEAVHAGTRARMLLDRIAPALLALAAGAPDADMALARLARFISSVGARSIFYSLLAENPATARELVKLFGSSVFLSNDLIERPGGLEILLSDELSIPYKKRAELDFGPVLEMADDYEAALDELRRIKNEEVFRIGINDIRGLLTPHQVSVQLSNLAEACVETAVRLSRTELGRRYIEPEESRFVVIGLGGLGAKELIYGSDLDIIFVYSENSETANRGGGAGGGRGAEGAEEISTHEWFVKLAQRIISALSMKTREGSVFDVDVRLRPSGSAGPLVVSLHSLIEYHKGPTSIWERQALVKARAIAGDVGFGTKTLGQLADIIYSKPLTANDISEMLRIRKRMEVEIANETSMRYNLKTGRGGLVDIEFLTQALQLKYARVVPGLKTPYTLKALVRSSKNGLIAREDYKTLKSAYGFFKLLEMRLRIVHNRPEGRLVKNTRELATLARRAGYEGPGAEDKLMADYIKHAVQVRNLYTTTLKKLIE